MYPGRVDEKGRIKLPTVFQQYLSSFGEEKLYVTSLDRAIANIYPIANWRQVENFLENCTDAPQEAEVLAFNSADLGEETTMDSQGRIVLSPELRRALGIENQPVHVRAFKGHIEVLSEAIYDSMKQVASAAPQQALKKIQQLGMKL